MPKVIIDGFSVVVEAESLDVFCDHMKEKDHQVSEADEWIVKTKVYFIFTFLISITFAKMHHY